MLERFGGVAVTAMWEVLGNPVVQVALSLTFLAVVVGLAYCWVSSLRDWSRKSENLTVEAMSNFEEMRREGDINEAEFRNIEAVLGRKGDSKGIPAGERSADSRSSNLRSDT